jgi:hypothetical protein
MGATASAAASIPISTRRPLTSAVWESPRAAKLDEARARARAKKQASEPVGSLEDFVRRQDAEVRKRVLRLEANARALATQFTFKPVLPPAPEGEDDEAAHKPDLAAFLARVSSHLKARNDALEKKREAAEKADSSLPRVGARGQSRVWAEKKLPRAVKPAAHAGEQHDAAKK